MIYFDPRHVTSPELGKIRFKPAAGGKYMARGEFGTIELKGLVVDEFEVYEIRTDIKRAVSLQTTSGPGVWFTYLKTSRPFSLTINGKATFSKREFNFFFHPRFKACCRLRKGKCAVISIRFSVAFLKKWKVVHPRFSKFLRAISNNKEATLSDQPINISAGMVAAMSGLFLESEDLVEIFRYGILVELLRVSILQSENSKPAIRAAVQGHVRDEARFIAATKYLARKGPKRITISKISKAVGLHYKKLTEMFKEKYGITVFRFRYEQRMKEARRLLMTTNMSMSEIGRALGYKNQSNLSNAFKKYFGTSAFVGRRKNSKIKAVHVRGK